MSHADSPNRGWNLTLALLFAMAVALIAYRPLSVSHDCAMYIQAGDLMIDGELPFVDFIDVNPPLISYLNVIPAGIARLLGTHPIPTFLVLVWLLSIASVVAARRFLLAVFDDDETLHANLIAVFIAAYFLYLEFVHSYGQREHLFALALIPYLALRFGSWTDRRAAWPKALVVGLLAGTAASLKPHFVAIAIAPDLYWMLRRFKLRPLLAWETAGLAGAGLAYAAHFAFLPESMKTAFFDTWLPFIASGYHAYDLPLAEVARRGALWLPPLASVFVFALQSKRNGAAWHFAESLAVAALIATGTYFVQMKGWPYHVIPATVLALATLAIAIAEVRPVSFADDGDRPAPFAIAVPRGLRRGAVAIAVVGLLAVTAYWTAQDRVAMQRARIVDRSPFAALIAAHTEKGDAVTVLSSAVVPAYPLLTQLELRPGSTLLWFFPIPIFYYGEDRPAGSLYHTDGETVPMEEVRMQTRWADEIRTRRPKVVAIDNTPTCQGCPVGFSVYEYLVRTQFIHAALVGYRYLGEAGKSVVFVRDDPAPTDPGPIDPQ